MHQGKGYDKDPPVRLAAIDVAIERAENELKLSRSTER